MSNKQSFEEKVKSLTAKQIIMYMVDGLRNPDVQIDMNTFGEEQNGGCFGCAATNTICKITGVKFTIDDIRDREHRAAAINPSMNSGREYVFLDYFETAIDWLRTGKVDLYNRWAGYGGFAEIKNDNDIFLPHLGTRFSTEDLIPYEQLANEQE